MTTLQTISASQASAEVPINENFQNVSFIGIFAKRQETTSALTWGYRGGLLDGATVTDDTLTLTDENDNYIVVLKTGSAAGTVSTSTGTTNWNDSDNYARLYKVTTASGVVVAEEDHRFGSLGLVAFPGFGGATGITVTDAGGYYIGTDVEAVLQELGARPVGVGVFLAGKPTASQLLFRSKLPIAIDFASNFSGSTGSAAVAATAQTDYDVQKNAVSVGTVRFAAAGTSATFITSGAVSFAIGDIISFHAPASPDSTLADVDWTLIGTRA